MIYNNRTINVGDKYHHFKGGIYEIVAVGKHSETKEDMVVYKALYNNENIHIGDIFIRPIDMFLSKVDTEKYPDVKQFYRFEKIVNYNINFEGLFESNIECICEDLNNKLNHLCDYALIEKNVIIEDDSVIIRPKTDGRTLDVIKENIFGNIVFLTNK